MLEVQHIVKSYEGKPLLRDISLSVGKDETICLLGPSGSGKSTLLLIIAGLERAESGRVLWNGEDITEMPANLRDFGLVFQDYALFPHLNVFDNVAFGLRMKRWPAGDASQRVREVLDLVDLSSFEQRKVTDLSGGEQQRVALARALAPRPRLLMFDEPLGALDRALREQLLAQLRRILHETGLPSIYVTHDQSEASAIADRVLLLHEGQIVREGSIDDVWAHPGSAWAAEFLGAGKVIRGTVLAGGRRIETPYGVVSLKCAHQHRSGEHVWLLMRAAEGRANMALNGRVTDVVFQQGRFRVTLDNGLFAYVDAAPRLSQNLSISVQIECLE